MWTWDLMAVFAVIMTASVLVHEMAHKIIAQQKGLWAEFRLTTWGVLLTFVSVFLPFRMIAPGAMMIAGSPNGDDIVKISLAGPATNIILSAGILGVAFALFPSAFAFDAVFRCLHQRFPSSLQPNTLRNLGRLQNFQLEQEVWALAFIPSLILTVFTFLYI